MIPQPPDRIVNTKIMFPCVSDFYERLNDVLQPIQDFTITKHTFLVALMHRINILENSS